MFFLRKKETSILIRNASFNYENATMCIETDFGNFPINEFEYSIDGKTWYNLEKSRNNNEKY